MNPMSSINNSFHGLVSSLLLNVGLTRLAEMADPMRGSSAVTQMTDSRSASFCGTDVCHFQTSSFCGTDVCHFVPQAS